MEDAREEGLDAVDKWIIRMQLIFERYQRELLRLEVPYFTTPLESQNLNPLYSRDAVLRYGERLLQSDCAYWNFYSRESVEEILNSLA